MNLHEFQGKSILKSFGVTKNEIRYIFFNKSMLTIIAGIFTGTTVGLLIAFLQKNYGLISMGSGSFVTNTYPVVIKIKEVILIIITVLIIGALASWYPVKVLIKKLLKV